jgi:UDP-N-acetylglucosamine 2-epimerase (non-hydrolysing)/GDP/UDP-N,N'-diacetylbacillosamine 2-epimerase (hydrolysing)
VLALGEEPWRVHRVGAPSLDHLRRARLLPRDALERELDLSIAADSVLVSYHPVTLARDTLREVDELFAALARLERQVLFSFPNADAGSRELFARARSFCESRPGSRLFVNLNPVTYWSLLGAVGVLLGNSSSGIMETASLGLPTVNVGVRQQGRERARNVLDAPAERGAIRSAVDRALDPAFRASLAGLSNPYGDGRAAERVRDVLARVPLGERLLWKRAVPVEPRWAGPPE